MKAKNSPTARFFSLSAADRVLIAEAALCVGAVRLALLLLPFDNLLIWLERASIRFRARNLGARPPASRIVWAILAASERVPKANSCLPRALSARFLLARWGYPAELLLGVAKDGDGNLEAHAWVETLGEMVIGKSQPGYFSPLAVDKAARR